MQLGVNTCYMGNRRGDEVLLTLMTFAFDLDRCFRIFRVTKLHMFLQRGPKKRGQPTFLLLSFQRLNQI